MENKKKKKKNPTRSTTSSAQRERREQRYNSADLGDFGLEPPKIYRESQKRITREQEKRTYSNRNSSDSRRRRDENITKADKRKKENKKRSKKNKARRIIISVSIAVFVVAVVTVICLVAFFNITDFTVSGSNIYSKNEIVSHFNVKTGDNLFLSDLNAAGEYLEQNLPYVYDVKIKRKLPSTVELTITDAKPAYSIKNVDKTYILLDDNFKVLETEAKKASGMSISKAKVKKAEAGTKIVFTDKDVGESLEKLAACIKENKFTEITAIYSNNISDNYVVYDKRITFKLGTCQELDKKIYQGLAACDKLNQSSPNIKGEMNITGDKELYFTER